MKKTYLVLMATLLLLVFSNGVQTQPQQTKPNQLELMKQFLGTWQRNVGIDTVLVWDINQFGKAYIANVYRIIRGQKTPSYINNMGFDSKEGKVKGYILMVDGGYRTMIGNFTSEKIFSGDYVQDFNPSTAYQKFQIEFGLNELIFSQINKEGKKVSENKFNKTK